MGWGVRSRRVALTAAVVGLVVGTAALASGSAVPVTLRLTGSADLEIGQSAKLTATAKLPKGARLLIQAFPTGRATTKVKECLRSPCSGTFRDSREEHVDFQASAIKRVGRKVTMLGRSTRVGVFWSEPAPPEPPPPPPPPPPTAAPGHYEGTIGNARAFLRFDVASDGLTMTNLQTGEIDESCDPPTITFWFTNTGGPGPFPIAADGSFSISGSGTFDFEGAPAQYSLKYTGKITGTTASGILRADTSLSLMGQGFSCSSGDQPWTAAKT